MSKILVVDDERIMLMLARRILSSKYEVVTATSGAEAIEIFERERPDLILSDLMMPQMTGYEMHKILQEKASATVPIIFMTADESDESESKGFAAGASDYIRKPIKPDVLLRRVENILNSLSQIQNLKVASTTDPMTGLLNKIAAQEEIGELVKKSSGALLMIDLDSFKLVNDIHGHAAGDKILIFFAGLIRKIIRDGDLAGRIGGDEFIAYLQNVGDEKILRDKVTYLNERLLLVAKNFLGGDVNIPLGASVGAIFVPDAGTDFASLCEKADSALYDVKHHGKHGLSIYGANRSDKSSRVAGISQMRMILDERTVEPGGYLVDFETFKKIYRLLVRMSDNFKNGLTLLQFTLREEISADEFKEILLRALRTGDCVTQNGDKFLVLMSASKIDDVRDKIFSRLKSAESVSFEREEIFR